MKIKLKKKMFIFMAVLIIAGTIMVTLQGNKAYASQFYNNCIDKTIVKPKFDYLGEGYAPMVVYANGGLNVRSGTGTNYAKIGWVANHETVDEFDTINSRDWAFIKYNTDNGCKVGWVNNKYLRPKDD